MSIMFLVLHSTLPFLLAPLFCSSSFDIYHIFLHIFLYLSLLLATNDFLSPALLSSTFLYIQLLVYHNTTRLSLLSILIPQHIYFILFQYQFFLYLPFVSFYYFYFCFLHLFYYSNYFFIITLSFFYLFYYIYFRFFYYYFM